MKVIYIPMILFMGISGAFGAFFFKKGSIKIKNIKTFLLNPYIYLGGFFYVLSSILNIVLLRKLPYITVISFGTLIYIWSFLLSLILLKERISVYKIVGVSLIIIGVIFAALNFYK